jgi:5-aminolevulinate synthase
MDYDQFFTNSLQNLHIEGRYRTFADLERQAGCYPKAIHHTSQATRPVTVWCSNDYLGMAQHPAVLRAAEVALRNTGVGAGGTRNISGTTPERRAASVKFSVSDRCRK